MYSGVGNVRLRASREACVRAGWRRPDSSRAVRGKRSESMRKAAARRRVSAAWEELTSAALTGVMYCRAMFKNIWPMYTPRIS
eukprot:scaffold29224_cov90-Isochrysis_galbana.AAC.1